jgi:F-type H+-transporting ATPase subunit b
MEIFWQLATGAALLGTEVAEEGGGFGLNFDILETNLINLSIVIAVVVYFGKGFLSNILGERRSAIETAIKEAEQRKQTAASALAEQQQKLAQAKNEAAKIRASAEDSAKAARDSILVKAEQDIQRMRETAAQEMGSDQERVINELRQRIAIMAMQRAENEIPSRLNDDVQQRLVNSSIAQLEVS